MKLANEGKCWAASLGGCGGPVTREHLATGSLFGKRIRVQGGFFGTPPVEISIRKLAANILCRDHNNELGRTADAAALRLFRHFKASHDPMQLPGSRILRPPVDQRVSGVNFGRWLCKTHCNFMVANGMTPNTAYIRYAFSHPPGRPIYIYFAAGLGDALRLVDGRYPVVSWSQLLSDDEPGFDGFSVKLAGFESMVTIAPIRRNGQQMIDRIRALEWPTQLGSFRIVFDWAGEPPAIQDRTWSGSSDGTEQGPGARQPGK
jgi:hypothetical protein